MKSLSRLTPFLFASVLFCSCATTSLQKSWVSPEHKPGALRSVATVAVDERILVRKVFEGQLASQLEQRGLKALRSHEVMALEDIKADRKAAAAHLREAGVQHALAVRLLDNVTYAREYREGSSTFIPVATGFYTDAWYSYCTVAFTDMTVTRGSMKNVLYLETSLFDLNTGHLLWRGITKTTLKEDADRLEEVRPLVTKIMEGMQKDGILP